MAIQHGGRGLQHDAALQHTRDVRGLQAQNQQLLLLYPLELAVFRALAFSMQIVGWRPTGYLVICRYSFKYLAQVNWF